MKIKWFKKDGYVPIKKTERIETKKMLGNFFWVSLSFIVLYRTKKRGRTNTTKRKTIIHHFWSCVPGLLFIVYLVLVWQCIANHFCTRVSLMIWNFFVYTSIYQFCLRFFLSHRTFMGVSSFFFVYIWFLFDL